MRRVRLTRWPVAVLRIAACGLVSVLLLCCAALPGVAHARLIGTTPADGTSLPSAPATVELSFNQNLLSVPPVVVMRDARGPVPTAPVTISGSRLIATLPAALPRGSYRVAWRVVTQDGHPVEGSFGFAVGEPYRPLPAAAAPRAPAPSNTAARIWPWLLGGALLVLVGLVLGLRSRRRRQP